MNTSGLRSLPACIKKKFSPPWDQLYSFTFLVSHIILFDPRTKINGAKKACEAKKTTHIRSLLLKQLVYVSILHPLHRINQHQISKIISNNI